MISSRLIDHLGTFLPERSVKSLYTFHTLGVKNDDFGLFIVLPLHKECLRNMIDKGLANNDVRISVLEMLKPLVCHVHNSHGDIKDVNDI